MATGLFHKNNFIKFLEKLFSYKALSPYSLIALLSLAIISLCFFLGHYSGILIDFGREVYYPEQMLQGKVLYKDLFNIYGPLSYQINALLYKIFGIKLSTLYFAGSVCSVGIVSGIYLIAKKFLSEFLSFTIGFFTISVGVATTSIFNFHFPYSWAMVYGLFAFLVSLYFLIKLISLHNSSASADGINLCISAFFAGISITCKYDFLLYSLVVLFFIIKNKNLKALLCFLSVPFISYGTLFLQGLSFSDLLNALDISKNIAGTNTLKYFYINSGIYFSPKVIPHDIFSFLLLLIPFSGAIFSYQSFERKNIFIKILSVILFISSFIFLFVLLKIKSEYLFDFVLPFILIFSLAIFKKLNSKLCILTVSTIFACAKVFWAVLINGYGTYYISVALITALALLFSVLHKKYEKITGFIILFIGIFFVFNNFSNINMQKIETKRGKIFTRLTQSESTKDLIGYINKNTQPNDKILIFPEGMMINFLTNRKSDDFYNSLIPLYTETFGEDKIIEYFSKEKPEYIILSNLNMKDYYFKYICQDYALDFCQFIIENYNKAEFIDNNSEIDNSIKYTVFKLR